MIRGDGKSWRFGRLQRSLYKAWFYVRRSMARDVEVVGADRTYRFRCGSFRELSRCISLFTKEAGTCQWIEETVAPGDVFYDVGANIGIYTIMAARRVGARGRVVAFEPHGANFACLLDNIAANAMDAIVTPCNFALGDRRGFFPFNYSSSAPGSSNSQLLSRVDSSGAAFTPEIAEFKFATTVDDLVAAAELAAPQHVKIDVDGNELLILRGMAKLLSSPDRPKSLQVEINLGAKDDLFAFMRDSGYRLVTKHYTRTGLRKIEAGGDPEAYAYNAIFEPA